MLPFSYANPANGASFPRKFGLRFYSFIAQVSLSEIMTRGGFHTLWRTLRTLSQLLLLLQDELRSQYQIKRKDKEDE